MNAKRERESTPYVRYPTRIRAKTDVFLSKINFKSSSFPSSFSQLNSIGLLFVNHPTHIDVNRTEITVKEG